MSDWIDLIQKQCGGGTNASPEEMMYGLALVLTMQPSDRNILLKSELPHLEDKIDAEIAAANDLIEHTGMDLMLLKNTGSLLLPFYMGVEPSAFGMELLFADEMALLSEIAGLILKFLDPDFKKVFEKGNDLHDVIQLGKHLLKKQKENDVAGEKKMNAQESREDRDRHKNDLQLIENALKDARFEQRQIDSVLFRVQRFSEKLPDEKQDYFFISLLAEIRSIINRCGVILRYNEWADDHRNQGLKAAFMSARHAAMREIWKFIESEKKKAFVSDHKLTYLARKYTDMYNKLTETVIGQDHAVNEFVQACFDAEMYEYTPNVPQAVFLFAGPPGVGKTFLAQSAAKLLERPFKAFDMGGFATEKAELGLIGSETLFSNATEGTLVGFVDDNPDAVILFDEIEKAHLDVNRLFLSMLDGARLENKMLASNTDFSHTIIIFTTNAGRSLYEDRFKNLSGTPADVIINELRKEKNGNDKAPKLPPELCSRFASQHIVMFNHMDISDMIKIINMRVEKVCKELEKNLDIEIEYDQRLALLLLMHYGNVDVRVVSGKAQQFIKSEIYELARQMMQMRKPKKIRKIRFMLDDDRLSQKVRDFFALSEEACVAVTCNDAAKQQFAHVQDGQVVFIDSMDALMEIDPDDIAAYLVDPYFEMQQVDDRILGLDDYDSVGIRIIKELLDKKVKAPVYLLEAGKRVSQVDQNTFFMRGVEDIVNIGTAPAGQVIDRIVSKQALQKKCTRLLQRRKIFDFETLQEMPDEAGSLCIRFYDITVKDAVNPDDEDLVINIEDRPNVRFEDVIGAGNAKNELKDFIKYLENPKKYLRNALEVPKGILLYGPPGTGKTMLAKAMAGECEAAFISISGSELRMNGEESIKRLFETGRKYAPAIVFIDEVDSIARYRTGWSGAEESMLNMFLTQMDGFKTYADAPVFVIAATNFEIEDTENNRGRLLDPAFLRRFGSRILVDLPNKEERELFLSRRLSMDKPRALKNTVTTAGISNIASRTPFKSLAELENILAQAFRNAARKGKILDDVILDEAMEEYLYGEERAKDEDQLFRTAVHEASHAYIYTLSGGKPVYLTVISRGDMGGYMQKDVSNEPRPRSREEYLWAIRTSLAGRVGEMVVFEDAAALNTGAGMDLKHASAMALRMITAFGMEEGHLFSVPYDQLLESGMMPEYAKKADRLLNEQEKECRALIETGKEKVIALANRLVEKSHLEQAEILEILSEK